MTTPRFSDLHDVTDLAKAAGIAPADIDRYASEPDQLQLYKVVQLRKRGRKRAGQFRIVHKALDESLSQLHRTVAMMVVAAAPSAAYVQGFVHGRSIRTNAAQHLGRQAILHGDIKGFFDAITVEQVRDGLAALGARPDIATLVSRVCTIDGRLRQGTRCSPALANLVCRQLDLDLVLLAGGSGSTYTRYADDMVFSGDTVPTSEAVAGLLQRHGFTLRDGQCHLQIRGFSQFVTGLHVFDDDKPRLPRRLKRRLRLVLHYVERFGVDAHFAHPARHPLQTTAEALQGMLRYVQSVEPALATRLRAQYRRGSAKSGAERAAMEAALDAELYRTDGEASGPGDAGDDPGQGSGSTSRV